ncbi:MAG: DUF4124 domain-containing protein [Gammaproteobacteria bacterium]|nr:DUF4124 domain-containing protein [Gammaproteobacteria bacterium]
MSKSLYIQFVLAFFLAVIAGQAGFMHAGEVYTWVDKEGVQNYADVPEEDSELLKFSYTDKENEAEEQSPEESLKDKKQARQKKNCDNARRNLEALTEFDQITRIDADGNEEVLSEAEKIQQRKKEQRYLAVFCEEFDSEEPESEEYDYY